MWLNLPLYVYMSVVRILFMKGSIHLAVIWSADFRQSKFLLYIVAAFMCMNRGLTKYLKSIKFHW